MKVIGVLLSLLTILFAGLAAANTIEIDEQFTSEKINSIYYSFAPTSITTAQQSDLKQWQTLTNKPLNLGVEQRPVWIQFTIKNTLNTRVTPILSIDNPLLNEVQVYHLLDKRRSSSININAPPLLPQQQIKNEPLLVKLTLPAHSNTTVIVKVSNSSGLRVPLTLWQADALFTYKSKLNLLYGLLIGFVFSLAISCLILYAFSRKQYFAYTGAITLMLSILLYFICGFSFIHTRSAGTVQLMIPMLVMLITVLFLPLQQQVCQPKTVTWFKVQKIIIAIYALLIAFIWLFPTLVVTLFCLITTPIVLGYYVVTTLLCIRQNPSEPQKALLLALCNFLAAIVYFIITVSGLYIFTNSRVAFVFICSLSCAFSLGYAVMKLFILQRDEQVTTQQTLIAKSAAQDALLHERLSLQESVRQELETQVDERTFELQVTLRELEEKNRELEQLNMEDPLTGIKNRRFFDKKLVMELRRSRREQTPLSVIMLDIDKFKVINDTYGHLTGDQVIRTAADTIKKQLQRPLDEVARYGGEEFVVLLPNTQNDGAIAIAEKIRHAIATNNVHVAGTTISFTISAGVYTSVAEDINNPEIFTERADKALYFAKQHGRNQVINFPIPQSQSRSV
ncbi:diguanylate cyclase [uncultured Pseudoalteromonas sp.]|uniref:sensor domain-containing diguanylate cyclase n=1 Tax=unclassified Pseudoalteromonas TaxID=194690 RepID=UPI0030D94573|tara:strand:- start:73836 stop:75701 length:1866 start_codon:yes stop_codon:yes gene_type:complete